MILNNPHIYLRFRLLKMKIKYIGNLNGKFTEKIKELNFPYENEKIGNIYTVFAISNFSGYTSYCIDEELSQPMWYPHILFEIIDPRISRYWIYKLKANLSNKAFPFFGFSEWVQDPNFYTNLVDGDVEEMKIFEKYKKKMELEFPNSSIQDKANIGDEQWLMCPYCIDAWEDPDKTMALVVCPKCLKTMQNPRNKDELPHLLNSTVI